MVDQSDKKAKRMVLRSPNQRIQKRSQYLRSRRVPKNWLKSERLQKLLAASGLGSRREMDRLIGEGKVEINGQVAQLGDKASPYDTVKVKGKLVKLVFPDHLPRVILYHKPAGEIVSRRDPKGRISVFDKVPPVRGKEWVSVGRLDFNTSGLLIFTTSGDLANRFTHPSFAVDREYAVRINSELSEEILNQLVTEGIELEDGVARLGRISTPLTRKNSGKNYWYHIVLREGRNREVRRIFETLGFTVSRLIRIRFGPIAIPPRLKSGQYYELNEVEVTYVLKEIGLYLRL